MPTVDEIEAQVRETEFTAMTVMTPAELTRTCLRIAQECKRVGFHKVLKAERDENDPEDSIPLIVHSGVTVAFFRVEWSTSGDSALSVSMRVLDHMVTQQSFLFIPVGPKKALALPALERFSHLLQERLAAS